MEEMNKFNSNENTEMMDEFKSISKSKNNESNSNNNNESKDINKKTNKQNSISSISKEEEIIYNKPLLGLSYFIKTRKDIKIHSKLPQFKKRVFITKTYNTNNPNNTNIEEPISIPKTNICYMMRDPFILLIDKKKESIPKSVVNNCYFITKLTGVKDIKNKNEMSKSSKGNDKEDKKKNKKKKKIKKKKKKNNYDDSYLSASSDNKNIVSNNKFKGDLFNKLNDNTKNNRNKNRNNHTVSAKNEKFKKSIPGLKFEKIKKNKKYSIKNDEIPSLRDKNKRNNKIRNNNNETISSIDNISDNEIESNENDENTNKHKNKNKRMKHKNLSLVKYKNKNNQNNENEENDEKNKSNQSTKIQIHKINRNNSNIKIQIKSPLSPTIKYQQIDIKTGDKNKSFRFFNPNNFRKNKNYIEAKNKDDININRDNNLVNSIKIKTGLKPLKFNNSNKNLIDTKNQVKNRFYLQN